jgi:hypothetical protein
MCQSKLRTHSEVVEDRGEVDEVGFDLKTAFEVKIEVRSGQNPPQYEASTWAFATTAAPRVASNIL